MKKLLIPALLVIIILSSCGEETPIPTPSSSSKKISEIYYEYERHDYISNDNGQTWNEYNSEYQDNELRERWTWNGDKLYSIENYSQFIYDDLSLNFTYDNGHISEITAPAINERMICYYDNDKISRIEFTSDNKSSEAWDLVYSGNKIIDKVDIPEYFTITWNGNNISMIKCFESDVCTIEMSYTYDNKQNPYHGSDALVALAIIKADTFALMSSNNMTSERINSLFPILTLGEEYYTYTYQYTNNYPTLKTQREEVILPHSDPVEYLSKSVTEKRYYINYLED